MDAAAPTLASLIADAAQAVVDPDPESGSEVELELSWGGRAWSGRRSRGETNIREHASDRLGFGGELFERHGALAHGAGQVSTAKTR